MGKIENHYQMKFYEKRKANGCCVSCGKPLTAEDKTLKCESCREAFNKYLRSRYVKKKRIGAREENRLLRLAWSHYLKDTGVGRPANRAYIIEHYFKKVREQ